MSHVAYNGAQHRPSQALGPHLVGQLVGQQELLVVKLVQQQHLDALRALAQQRLAPQRARQRGLDVHQPPEIRKEGKHLEAAGLQSGVPSTGCPSTPPHQLAREGQDGEEEGEPQGQPGVRLGVPHQLQQLGGALILGCRGAGRGGVAGVHRVGSLEGILWKSGLGRLTAIEALRLQV